MAADESAPMAADGWESEKCNEQRRDAADSPFTALDPFIGGNRRFIGGHRRFHSRKKGARADCVRSLAA
jgi:hypothetical protein